MNVFGKKILLFITFLTCLALVAVALLFLDDIFYKDTGVEPGDAADIEKDMNTVYIDGKPYVRRSGVENYLIFGLDTFGKVDKAGIAQADFIMVLSFDRLEKRCTMLPINRDTMTEVDVYDAFGNKMGTKKQQIALSHATGSSLEISNGEKCRNTEKAVSNLLKGVEFEGYMALTMDAVKMMIDCVGGVSVYIEEDLTDVDPRLVKGETVLLEGDLAVSFLRARGELEDSSNVSRMKRQEAFMQAFFKQADDKSVGDEKLIECFESMQSYMVTNLDMNGIQWMLGLLLSYEKNPSVTLPGEVKTGEKYIEFYVDQEGLMNIVTEYFFYVEE